MQMESGARGEEMEEREMMMSEMRNEGEPLCCGFSHRSHVLTQTTHSFILISRHPHCMTSPFLH
jgi:hypothetical protein